MPEPLAPAMAEGLAGTAIESLPILAWVASAEGSLETLHGGWTDYTGVSRGEIEGWDWISSRLAHPHDGARLVETWRVILASGRPGEAAARLRRADGEYRWFLMRAAPQHDGQGRLLRWYGTLTDVDDQKRSEAFLRSENQLLGRLAGGDPLVSILDGLCQTVEQEFDGAYVSILLLDPKNHRLWYGSHGSLPATYTSVFDGITVGPEEGGCGTAAYRNEPVISEDLAVDPLWARYREVPIRHGIRACWSTPIHSSDGGVLGTFAILSREPGRPSAQHQRVIAQITHLASVAIERARMKAALAESEAYLAEAQRLSATGSFGWRPASGEILWSEETYCIFGVDRGTKPTVELVLDATHPEDRPRLQQLIDSATREARDWDFEHRLLMPDGSVKHLRVVAHQMRHATTGESEYVGAVMDVTAAKESRQALEKAYDEIQELKEQLQNENIVLREEVGKATMFEEVVGTSAPLRAVLSYVAKVAPTESTVLITGETGTGKELIARAIHERSRRSSRVFVSVNCGSIPPALVASELFGHEKGAFTGAIQRRAGRFELAEGGTLFLDEVGELPPEMQIVLLRVLQEREFERVGGTKPIRADVRLLAATNRNLDEAVAEGSFRSDLFYRLNVVPVAVPSLRERREDIPLLVEYFVDRYSRNAGKRIKRVGRKSLELLESYSWPGNIRELQNVIERAVILAEGDTLTIDEHWLPRQGPSPAAGRQPFAARLSTQERDLIEAALAETQGRVSGASGAAAKLQIPASTLESKIRTLGIDKRRFRRVYSEG